MTLSVIVTVAPMPLPAEGRNRDPTLRRAVACAYEGALHVDRRALPRERPPVIVTPEIVTVGSLAAPASPTARTGPPPLMIVDAAPRP
jgi:hypothetical protein